MRIVVDREVCEGLGMCESMVPEIFEVQDDDTLLIHDETPGEDKRTDVASAVEACPVQALRLEG